MNDHKNKPQRQDSLQDQLEALSEYAKVEEMSSKVISRILHGNLSPLTEVDVRSELIQCVALANKNGLYDAADHIKHYILGLK